MHCCVQHNAHTRETCTYLSSFSFILLAIAVAGMRDIKDFFFFFFSKAFCCQCSISGLGFAFGPVSREVGDLFLGKRLQGEKKKLLKVCSCLVESSVHNFLIEGMITS